MTETVSSFNPELLRVWWIVAGMLVLLMQLGFICLEMGCVGSKSRPGIAVKNFVMLIVSVFTFTLIGAHLMYGSDFQGLIGFGPLRLWLQPGVTVFERGPDGSYGWLFFQAGFAAVAATIISGALAGRTTLFSNGFLAFVMALFIYPIYGHWIWGDGWLFQAGARDFAGSGAVHYIGGVTALLAAMMAGPREGFIRDGKVQDLGSPNLPFATSGVILLWVGWIGFNGGSVLPDPHFVAGDGFALVGRAVLATCTAASGGGLAIILVAAFFHWRYGRGERLSLREALRQKVLFDPWAALGGTMGGMVAITANCDWVSARPHFLWIAAGIGAAGGLAAFAVAYFVKQVLKVDDPVEAVGVHAGGGAAGMLLASFHEESGLPAQLLALAAAVTCVLLIAYPCLYALRKLGLLRASPTDEKLGLTFEPFESSVYTADIIERQRTDHH